jgi:two-component system phosphate regulon sensor histidine kinase PhoR
MLSKLAFPWFYFYRVARLAFIIFTPALFLIYYLFQDQLKQQETPAILFLELATIATISFVLFLYFFYRMTRPLGSILAKVERFNLKIPFEKNLQLLYQKDQWAMIEEALNEADQKLKEQMIKAQTENEKIATILESIFDDIIAIDNFETILFYNSNFNRNFMRSRPESEISPRIWHIFQDQKLLDAFRSVLQDGRPVNLKNLNAIAINNPGRYFDLTITPLKNANGKTIGALGVFYDITEFKLTEQMRVDFVANVSHEIRTPLTSIKGYVQILQSQKSKVDPDFHLFLEKIISNTERMISLFNDLLNLSVIESGNSINLVTFSLTEVMDSVESNIKTNYQEKKINVIKQIENDSIIADQRLVEQVLSNLIDNACKYSGDVIQIDIASKIINKKFIITIKDNGPGIAPEHLQRIFERFYRIDSSREVSRGTGLGLSIVKHIISKHGGRIWAESDGVMGTTFLIELPA